ncbi:hypothetical protein [Sulfurihydrogenibium subterraneum]|uniref:hypothetical protein n=1 Tax=Sulfurihydrogenibium subterraneum TaxID=171121 RepID=UPI00048CE8C7|nr:hypothetical protein [Sulfurihydrogenibium subterraneum]
MKKILAFLFTFITLSKVYADSLIVNNKELSTYIQYSQFLLAQGETVIGPIQLLPVGKVDSVLIKPTDKDVKVVGYIIEPTKENWVENLVGKTIAIEGEGRLVRGTVISVKDGYITIDTKNGVVMTTLPVFPNRLSSALKWQDLMAPKLTIKLYSERPASSGINILYPVSGFEWNVIYSAEIQGDKVMLNGFYEIKNNTAVKLTDVALYIKSQDRVVKLYDKTVIEPYTSKLVLIDKFVLNNAKEIKVESKKFLPDGKVAIYKNSTFIGYGNLTKGVLRLP